MSTVLISCERYGLGVFSVRENVDGKNHRRPLCPGDDISTEPQEVQDVCNAAWTDDVVRAYEAHKAEQV